MVLISSLDMELLCQLSHIYPSTEQLFTCHVSTNLAWNLSHFIHTWSITLLTDMKGRTLYLLWGLQ